MQLHISQIKPQMSLLRRLARARSGIPNSTQQKVVCTGFKGSGQTLSVTIMCRREISAPFYQKSLGEGLHLQSMYFAQQLLVPGVKLVFKGLAHALVDLVQIWLQKFILRSQRMVLLQTFRKSIAFWIIPFLQPIKLSAGEHVSSERDMNGILHESLESKDSRRPCHPLYFLPSNSGLSKSQKKIVEERVQAIKSEVPIYVAIMRRVSLGISYKPILVSSILF